MPRAGVRCRAVPRCWQDGWTETDLARAWQAPDLARKLRMVPVISVRGGFRELPVEQHYGKAGRCRWRQVLCVDGEEAVGGASPYLVPDEGGWGGRA